MAGRLLTMPQVAEHFQVGLRTVYDWIAAGLIERVDIGTKARPKTRISESALENFAAARTIPARKKRAA